MKKSYQIVDLSVPLQADIWSDPPAFLPQIDYVKHEQGAGQLQSFFPGLQKEDLPNREGWAVEFVKMSTHAGTHMDAPYHYGSKMADGSPTMTIDQVPLEWCIGSGVKLDFRHFEDGYVVTPKDIRTELERIEHTLKTGDIVLIQTSAGEEYGKEGFLNAGCGVGREATLFLVEQGVHLVGTDAWSWDAPFSYTKEKYERTGEAGLIWEGHFAGTKRPYCQIEKLNNLSALPATGFTVISLPVKVHRASGGWARPIALIDNEKTI